MRLFHLLPPGEWRAAVAAGEYRPPSLATEGFVHLSFAEQVTGSANRHCADAAELVAVEFDGERLPGRLVVEDSYGSGTAFPHLYAPIDPAAAVAAHPLRRDAAGAWVFTARDGSAPAVSDR